MGRAGFPKKHLNTTAVLVCKKRSTFKESLIVFIYVRTYIYFIHIYIYLLQVGYFRYFTGYCNGSVNSLGRF